MITPDVKIYEYDVTLNIYDNARYKDGSSELFYPIKRLLIVMCKYSYFFTFGGF